MQKQFCLIGKMDRSMADLSDAFKARGFQAIGISEDVSETEGWDLKPEFLAIINHPDPSFQRDAVNKCKSVYPSTPIIILTETLDLDTMMLCFELGAVEYIVKSKNNSRNIGSRLIAALGEKVWAAAALKERPAA